MTGREEERAVVEAAKELLAAIDRRWGDETAKRRESAISPRMEEAIEALSDALYHLERKP